MLTRVLDIGCASYSWCGRCYISACMVHPRVRRPLFTANNRSTRGQQLSKEDRLLLPQLLELLRSGALSSLLPNVSIPSTADVSEVHAPSVSSPVKVSPSPKHNAKSKNKDRTDAVPPTDAG